jgi:hypothetical protein
MKCYHCEAEEKKSRLYYTLTANKLFSELLYDEDGHQHIHHVQEEIFEYKCTNGHAWTWRKTEQNCCGTGQYGDDNVCVLLSEARKAGKYTVKE